MLQSSFNIIKQHFSPNSQIDKNIFIIKDYDYPSLFFQKLYLSYLDLEQTLRTKPTQQIAKRINIVTNKNDKNFEKTILGFVYAIMLHYPRAIKTTDTHEKQKSKLLDSTYDLKIYSEKILNQLGQFFTLFRNQTWGLFNHISLELILGSFMEIKPIHRCGFIAIFRYMQKFLTCQDDYFMALMKTLNFYDQKNWSMKYNLELMSQLNEIINKWKKGNEMGNSYSPQEMQKNFSKVKINEQLSLMRHYLFGKLVHWQFMTQKMSTYLKGQWPLNLQRTCTEALKMLKTLYQSNPQECVVFSGQFSRYTEFQTQDYELKQILLKIGQSSQRALSSQLIGHHFSLVPIALQFLIPYQIQQQVTQMARNLYEVPQQNMPYSRVEKHNVHMIMGWLWKDCIKQFSEENNKNYLVENSLQDIVRWCLMSHTKNLQLRSFVIEWVMYSSGHNEALSRTVKEAFFSDWFYYLKIATQVDFNAIFGILTASIHILNYFAFCAPSLAQGLFLFILGKGVMIKTSYQTGVISQGMFRVQINEILKRANRQGILRVREILYQSQLSNYIKKELEIRIQQGENAGIETYGHKSLKQKPKQLQLPREKQLVSENFYGRVAHKLNKIVEEKSFHEKNQYYGDKELEIQFEMKEQIMMGEQQHSDEEDLIYTSHQLIPSSPTYPEEVEPHSPEEINQNDHNMFSLQERSQLKKTCELINPQKVPSPHLDLQYFESKNVLQSAPKNNQSSQIIPQAITSQPPQTQAHKKTHTYQIKLQKEFLEQMGPSINSLIQSPTINQFTQYMKDLIKVLKQYKKSSQQEQLIEKFLKQTAKILYLIFNKEFQSFDFGLEESRQTKDSLFLSYFLLKSIHQNWKQSLVIYNIFVYKKLVKCLCEAFPSAEFTFYYVFLDIFKKGTVHFKEMKQWLIPSEREKIVIPVLKKLSGSNFKMHIYENAQVLKIQ